MYTVDTGDQVNVAFTGAVNTWQTVSLTATAVSSVIKMNVLAQVFNVDTVASFSNFNFYEEC